jgi:drug/metabolite transporter (DMT)-like permease
MHHYSGKVYFIFSFTLAGSSVVAAKLVAGRLGIFTITTVSLLFAFLLLAILCFKDLQRYIRTITHRELIPLLLQAFFGIFLFRMFLLWGLQHTDAGEAGILTGATPAITTLLAIILLKERINRIKLMGIICTVCGILILQNIMTLEKGLSSTHFFGNILILCAAACESTFNILSRAFALKQEKIKKPIIQTTIVTGFALLFSTIPALFEHPLTSLKTINTAEWIALVWYGIFVTGIAFICWYAGINRSDAITAAAFSGLMPFTSALLAAILLKETIGVNHWVGGSLIIMGMLLIGTNHFHSMKIFRKKPFYL